VSFVQLESRYFYAFESDFLPFLPCRFVTDISNNDDSHGTVAAHKIRALLQFVKHPAYRLELLTSKVTGRFFCPVNGDVKLGQTPLHFAVSLGKWEAVKALLEDACCLLDGCFTETYDFIVAQGPEPHEMEEEAQTENPDISKKSESSLQPETPDKPSYRKKRNELLEAAIRQLYAQDELDTKDQGGNVAAKDKAAGVQPVTNDEGGKSQPDTLKLLSCFTYKEQLKRQYSILWTKDSQGNSVFHLAVIHNQMDMYKKLRGYSENLSKALSDLYLGQKVATDNSEKLIGSKFNSFAAYDDEFLKNGNGYTPLELAAYLGNVEMMRFLLNTFESQPLWGFANKSVVLNKVYRLYDAVFQFAG
jgi:ankyrin repeat protein